MKIKMKIITQEEFYNLPRNELGIKVVPAFSDLRNIREFPENCIFGNYCRFGEYCIFGGGCTFGEYCTFGKGCTFDEYCRFNERCSFGENCTLNGLKILNYKAIDRIGRKKRKLYCWNLEGEIYFRAGCFFGKKDEFLKRVDEEYEKNSEYHLAIEFLEKLTSR